MPITSSAKKVLRASDKKQIFNLRRKNKMKDVIKKYTRLLNDKKTEDAKKMLPELQKAIDKAIKRGVIKKNTGARKKSSLMLKLSK